MIFFFVFILRGKRNQIHKAFKSKVSRSTNLTKLGSKTLLGGGGVTAQWVNLPFTHKELSLSQQDPFKVGVVVVTYNPCTPTVRLEAETGEPTEAHGSDVLAYTAVNHRDSSYSNWKARINTRSCPPVSTGTCSMHTPALAHMNVWTHTYK